MLTPCKERGWHRHLHLPDLVGIEGGTEARARHLALAWSAAIDFLLTDANWYAVKTVAQALFRQRRLTGKEVHEMVATAHQAWAAAEALLRKNS
jgi:hypothetical protein